MDNSITFKAASKSFGLAAMKCAWFFTTNRDLYNAVSVTNHADLSTLGMIASQAAYAGGEDWLNQCVDYVDGNHDFVQSYFKSGKMPPLIKIGQKAQGTYLTWLDTSELAEKIGAREMADDVNKRAEAATGRRVQQATPDAMTVRWLARQSFVALNAGENYGLGGVNHMRMNIATSRKTLEAALDSIAGACRRA